MLIFGIILTDLSIIDNTKKLHDAGLSIVNSNYENFCMNDEDILEEIKDEIEQEWTDVKYYLGFILSDGNDKLCENKEKDLTSLIERELTPVGIGYFKF